MVISIFIIVYAMLCKHQSREGGYHPMLHQSVFDNAVLLWHRFSLGVILLEPSHSVLLEPSHSISLFFVCLPSHAASQSVLDNTVLLNLERQSDKHSTKYECLIVAKNQLASSCCLYKEMKNDSTMKGRTNCQTVLIYIILSPTPI